MSIYKPLPFHDYFLILTHFWYNKLVMNGLTSEVLGFLSWPKRELEFRLMFIFTRLLFRKLTLFRIPAYPTQINHVTSNLYKPELRGVAFSSSSSFPHVEELEHSGTESIRHC